MLASHRIPSFVILAAATALGGCAIPTSSTQLNPGPEPIELQMTPTVIYAGQWAELMVRSPVPTASLSNRRMGSTATGAPIRC